ncbi:citrate synthase [Halovivax asiaticus JCM 14624]|uniref:Citrate synthase n=1 Tax=Halovivax asiaticus JCM 14624 TaxID=1227490 RepID=M0BCJ3_9EURY|nr:citrate/2-methylcitrate synthase [Halovivax asiaticus]ELZ08197.1 citrate synthase [Halovivax asiaticus JCM 14624]
MDETVRTGLDGVVADETRLSAIDGDAGQLTIGGFALDELAGNATFEETLFVLYEDRLPTADELENFSAELAEYRALAPATRSVVEAAAERGQSAMDAARMGLASASLARPASAADDVNGETAAEDSDRDALIAVAQLPTIVATYWRAREDEELIDPSDDLSHAGNYLYMLTGEEPTDSEVRGLETYLNAVVDHGFNASTFTGRTIASTESDVISAVTGAVGALKGPLHGGAPGPVLDMLEETHAADDVRSVLATKLDDGERLMGFGHRVYNVRDPRAAVLSEGAEAFYRAEDGGDEAFYESAVETESVARDLLADRRPDLDLETNVEFYTAIILRGVGIPQPLFSATFAVARVGGWTAHALEQLADNRIVRPRSAYIGEYDRTWTPIDER